MANTLEKICTSMGKNNKPTYVVMAIAAVKGICRPAFTMMDEKENPKTKKYTAIREGLTEVIAIPVYWFCGEISGKLTNLFAKPKNFMDKELYSQYKAGNKSEEVLKAYKTAKTLAENNLPKINKNLMFAGVCGAALFAIPALCSIAIKPIMNKIQENNSQKKDIIPVQPKTEIYYPNFQHNYKRLDSFAKLPKYGMKVGGV